MAGQPEKTHPSRICYTEHATRAKTFPLIRFSYQTKYGLTRSLQLKQKERGRIMEHAENLTADTYRLSGLAVSIWAFLR